MATEREILEEKVRRKAYDSLETWTKLVWREINPGVKLVWAPWMSALCKHLEAQYNGEFNNIVINIPPGHSKTTICSLAYPLWIWGREPEYRMLFGSWSNTNLLRDQRVRLRIVQGELYKQVFPKWRSSVSLDLGSRSVRYFTNTLEGFMRKVSVQSQDVTGAHAKIIIIDDPLPAQSQGGSEAKIAQDWWSAMTTRFTDLKSAKICCIMQRIRADDLAGFFIEKGMVDCHICLPAQYDPKLDPGPTPLGWRDPRNVPGELLFPERFPLSVLQQKRSEMGPVRYSAQYQQAPAGGVIAMFQDSWWRYWNQGFSGLPGKPDDIIGVFDTSEGLNDDSDFSCGQVWYLYGDSMYLVDQFHARMDPSQLNHHGSMFVQKYPQARWYVEKQNSGSAFLSHLRSQGIRVNPWTSRQSKTDRIIACLPYVEQGRIYLPLNSPAAASLTAEACLWPKARYDDQVDAMAVAIGIWKDRMDAATPQAGSAGTSLRVQTVGKKRSGGSSGF